MATFFNQATLSYNNTVTNSNIVTGELLEALSVSKTAVSSTYRQGDTVTYVISLVNTGAVAVTDLTVSDDLGGYPSPTGTTLTPLTYVADSVRYYRNGVLQAAPTVTEGPPLVFTGISVPAGGNATLVYAAEVNSFATPTVDGTVLNTVTVSGASVTTPITASETITALSEATLTITKAVSPTLVVGGGPLTYTFVIQNLGNAEATAADNVTVTDLFNPILSLQSVTLDGAPLDETDYTYNEATGEFATVPGVITVPAATYTQNPVTGSWEVAPGIATLTVVGTV